MTCGPDEVKARVDAQIRLLAPLRLLLLAHVRFMLVIDELHNRQPRVAVVHVVAESRGVDHRELDLELLLLELGLDDLNLRQLVHLLHMSPAVVLRRRKLRREQGVDECRLAQAGFTFQCVQ